MTSKLMKAGWAAYDTALLHAEHDQPLNKIKKFIHDVRMNGKKWREDYLPLARGVYAPGVYNANCNALFCCK